MIIRPAFYGFNNIKINPIKFSLSSRHCAPHRQQQICTMQCVLFSLSLSPANTIIICRAAPLAASALLFHIGFPPATLLLASPVIICSCKNALYPLSVHTHTHTGIEPQHLITHWKLISHCVERPFHCGLLLCHESITLGVLHFI